MASMGQVPAAFPVCRAPLTYVGQGAVRRDIANVKAAMAAAGVQEGFLNAVAPGSCARFQNDYYKDDEELLWVAADVMREEYQAIVDAGLILQLDDPCIAENWDQILPEPAVEDYQRSPGSASRRSTTPSAGSRRIASASTCAGEAGTGRTLPTSRCATSSRSCWRSPPGRTCSRRGNVRHEHEWNVWREVKLPDGKIIMPGVVSHATSLVEHPELVADRIVRFAEGAGRENVIARTDCGLGGRVHPEIAWAKLESLVRGAELATSRLWS
jgi:5-methyltetrahydropteroyltriglutamate--homocysteine methyltransferase